MSHKISTKQRMLLWLGVLTLLVMLNGCRKVVPDSGQLELPADADSAASPAKPVPAARDEVSVPDPPAAVDQESTSASSAETAPRAPKVATIVEQEVDLPVYEPTVVLSDDHAAASKIGVGDAMPPLVLQDLQGDEQALADLRGEKLTIVVFWTAQQALAKELFERLGIIAADRYSGLGVNVVAVNVGDNRQTVEQLNEQHGGSFACLLDPKGEALAQVATEILPRIYLLDGAGRVVWFDLENSRFMRRALHNAVRYYLSGGDAVAKSAE